MRKFSNDFKSLVYTIPPLGHDYFPKFKIINDINPSAIPMLCNKVNCSLNNTSPMNRNPMVLTRTQVIAAKMRPSLRSEGINKIPDKQ